MRASRAWSFRGRPAVRCAVSIITMSHRRGFTIVRRHLVALVTVVLFPLLPALAHAGAPTEQLRSDIARVFQALDALPTKDAPEARRLAVHDVSRNLFDLGEMARRMLGRLWETRSDDERGQFIALLESRVDGQIAALETYGGATVAYLDETIDGDRALVRSRVSRHGRDLTLDYRLLRHADRWLIWDVSVDNVSLVGQYRAQFQKIIRASSYEALVKRLAAQ